MSIESGNQPGVPRQSGTGETPVLLLLLAVLACGCGESSPFAPSAASIAPTRPWFEDITARSGLEFVHDTGPTGRFRIPEQMGSGAAWFDFDNDGRLDIYLVQNAGPTSASKNKLFHQEADGRFKDVSAGSGLDVAGYGMGVAVGDVNNDGLPDVLLTEYGAVRLFLNQGVSHFADVTAETGLDNPRWATSGAFFDYDRDGWLDLVVANYLDFDPTVKCFDAKGAPEFCGPHGFPGLVTKLFHNLGTRNSPNLGAASPSPRGEGRGEGNRGVPRFEDVSVKSGLARLPGPALGVLCADFDGDHWPDIFLADDGRPNRLFINQHNGTFNEEAAVRGLAYNAMGQTAGNMGIALGDADGDGLFDLFVTHLAEEFHALWRQGPRGVFQDRMALAGLNAQGWRGTGFGAALVDFDHDGDLDLAFVNGLVKRGPQSAPAALGTHPFWAPYAQRHQLFANDGRGHFQDLSEQSPALCGTASVGRGLACGDFDNDGAVDLLVSSTGGPVRLLRNIAPKSGHWLTVRAIDPAPGGRDAYGAEITMQAGGRRWWRLVSPAYSYLCSNDPRTHFGLGSAAAFDLIQVVWPSGEEETFPGGAADRLVLLRKGTGTNARR
jgi:hypothetical protein